MRIFSTILVFQGGASVPSCPPLRTPMGRPMLIVHYILYSVYELTVHAFNVHGLGNALPHIYKHRGVHVTFMFCMIYINSRSLTSFINISIASVAIVHQWCRLGCCKIKILPVDLATDFLKMKLFARVARFFIFTKIKDRGHILTRAFIACSMNGYLKNNKSDQKKCRTR